VKAALETASPSLLARTRVVLVHPFFPENVGAAARAMKNAGLSRLVVADPGPALPDHPNALKLAVMADDVLARAELVPTLDEAIADASLVIGTSRQVYKGMTPVSPREAARLAGCHATGGGAIALVFGNEKNGLTKAELRRCHQVIRIPAATEETSLNLAQAMMIVAYEWLMVDLEPESPSGRPLTAEALAPEIAAIVQTLGDGFVSAGFLKSHNRAQKEAVLRRVQSRVILEAEEASVFRGLAHRMGLLLKRFSAH